MKQTGGAINMSGQLLAGRCVARHIKASADVWRAVECPRSIASRTQDRCIEPGSVYKDDKETAVYALLQGADATKQAPFPNLQAIWIVVITRHALDAEGCGRRHYTAYRPTTVATAFAHTVSKNDSWGADR